MALLIGSASQAYAMAVAYKDSFGIMAVNQSFHNELFTNYSFESNFAVGHRYIRYLTSDGQRQFFVPEADFLIHRWNNTDSQGNLWFSGGFGAQSFLNNASGVGMGVFEADWESRRYYLDSEFQSLLGADSRWYNTGKIRAGIAPYLAEFNEINSWFIVQLESMPFVPDSPFLTPVVRLFYRNVLVEIGADFQGNWLFNYMVHL